MSCRFLPLLAGLLVACTTELSTTMTKPADFSVQRLHQAHYPDLLTGGLGLEGLRAPSPPGFSAGDWDSLRRLALWGQWKGLVDLSPAGGYGTSYARRGLVFSGTEIVVELRVDGARDSLVALQIPDNFDRARPCLIAAPSSGSRNVYGAVPTTGPWALARGCAVVYSDKGVGTGLVDLDTGTRYDLPLPGVDDGFPARDTLAPANWRQSHPHRLATRHAHDPRSDEAQWGERGLRAIRFALDELARRYPDGPRPKVIAASISNGGGASLRAAELDQDGLIDAVAVAEPNVNLPDGAPTARLGATSLPAPMALYDYAAAMGLYLPCLFDASACQRLAQAGLLSGADTPAQQQAARAELARAGVAPDSTPLLALSHQIQLFPALLATYASAYSQATPAEAPGGIGFAVLDAEHRPIALPAAVASSHWALSGGVPPSAGVGLVYARDPADAVLELARLAPRQPGADTPERRRLAESLSRIRVTANLHGKPALIVHGRADALITVNNSSRPYLALNRQIEGPSSGLRYIEITRAQHFDAFLAMPALASEYLPLLPYYEQALDRIWAHLFLKRELPPSQVVQTLARGTEALQPKHLPDISDAPAQPIGFEHATPVFPAN